MASTRRNDLRRVAGLVGTAGLGGAAAVHVAWAAGSTWPASDREDLADLVVGRTPFPSAPLTAAVAGLLGTATLVSAAASGAVPVGAGRGRQLARAGAAVVAAGLLVRGAGGLAVSAAGVGDASERFRRWDLRVYSPLCLVLGSAVALGSRSPDT